MSLNLFPCTKPATEPLNEAGQADSQDGREQHGDGYETQRLWRRRTERDVDLRHKRCVGLLYSCDLGQLSRASEEVVVDAARRTCLRP